MHLTPEQIDRQPFKMSRRGGYDIVQVRDFLREIAAEMRERQQVRERLAKNGDDEAKAEEQAKASIRDAKAQADAAIRTAEAQAETAIREADEKAEASIREAEARAAEIIADAEQTAGSAAADAKAQRVLAAAESEAEALVDGAETRARARSASVLAEAQVRLDELLAQERELRRKINRQTTGGAMAGTARAQSTASRPPADARDRAPIAEQDNSFAEFMKSTLRGEDL